MPSLDSGLPLSRTQKTVRKEVLKATADANRLLRKMRNLLAENIDWDDIDPLTVVNWIGDVDEYLKDKPE